MAVLIKQVQATKKEANCEDSPMKSSIAASNDVKKLLTIISAIFGGSLYDDIHHKFYHYLILEVM